MRLWCLLFILIPLFAGGSAAAHELRPAYLDLREVAPDSFVVLWKVPAAGQMRLGLDARLPENCISRTEPMKSIEAGAYLERWTTDCNGGLKGRTISIDGLSSTMTDVLVHITYRDGATEIVRLKPDRPSFTVAGQQTTLEVAATYFLLGVEHILGGFDHLLFVLALILLIHEPRQLVKTVTAFTVAHSITLAGAALGYFSLPQPPVEATIALSIAFVASEILKADPQAPRLSERYTWVVAFAFGLLHGFGFAGAPQGNRLAALRRSHGAADLQPWGRGRAAPVHRRGANDICCCQKNTWDHTKLLPRRSGLCNRHHSHLLVDFPAMGIWQLTRTLRLPG